MIDNDPFVRLQAQVAALEYVQKITLQMVSQVISQISPGTDLKQPMLQMLSNSVAAANVNADDPSQAPALRQYVLDYGRQIIEAGFGARPAQSK